MVVVVSWAFTGVMRVLSCGLVTVEARIIIGFLWFEELW